MKLTKELILSVIHEQKSQIERFGVVKLVLFGSFARDEQSESSDIDFLVEFSPNRGNYADFIKLKHFLEDTFNTRIDVVEIHSVREELKPYIFGGATYEARI